MVYIVFGICAVLCVAVAILAVKVVKENRKMTPKNMDEDEDEIWS